MDKAEAIKLGKAFKKAVEKQMPVSAVVLYGSYANGTATQNSDIDIAVLIDTEVGNYFEYVPKLWRLRLDISTLIEPVLVSTRKDPTGFLDTIRRTGILL